MIGHDHASTNGVCDNSGETGKTTAQMKTLGTFTSAGWIFPAIWGIAASPTASRSQQRRHERPPVGGMSAPIDDGLAIFLAFPLPAWPGNGKGENRQTGRALNRLSEKDFTI